MQEYRDDKTAFIVRFILGSVVIALLATTLGCSGSQNPKVEAAPSPETVVAKQEQMAKLPPPVLDHVQQAVKRIFDDAAVVDVSQQTSFLAGDFNGDLSQDLAVVIKPASGKLDAMNEEYPKWLLRDPLRSSEERPAPLRIAENEQLLAIIHGYGSYGWRDSEATQTYLLKNAVGTGLSVQGGKEFVAANTGKPLPQVHGDLIGEALGGASGYLYYAGPTYSWYDPKTFKGETRRGMVHSVAPKLAAH